MKRFENRIEFALFNPDSGIGGPWLMDRGQPNDVKGGMCAILDGGIPKWIAEGRPLHYFIYEKR